MSEQPGQLSLSQQEQIDRLADQFEAEFGEDPRPAIEDYVSRHPELGRHLLTELLRLEIELRRAAGEKPDVDEYRRRFPEVADLVEAEFGLGVTEKLESKPTDEDRDDREAAPQQIGRYQIRRRLGKGGFGIVYLAHDPQLNRPVAIKMPRRKRFKTAEQVSSFVEEARTAANLKHPGLVAVHDVQEENGLPYIVQEYIEGSNLAEWSRQRQPTFEELAQVLASITEALGYAHQQRLTHCDLKLANVLMDMSGQPHVADFGLAVHESTQLNWRGKRFGTPNMMAPEQVRGEGHRVDGRTDIWAVGVMMYELIVSRKPFTATDRDELYDQILTHDPRPPRQVERAVPRELERICLKCLSKRSRDRYNSAHDLREDLIAWIDAVASTPATRSSTDASTGDSDAPTPESSSNSQQPLKIIPKGLRSFDEEDADFFLDLLPGPRDRDGLPDSVRFWKRRIEEADPDKTFSVGLIYGPSGCGKSSMVKAGLIPLLSDHVLPIYVEATASDTEVRILKQIRKHVARLEPINNLRECCEALRVHGAGRNRKTLIVIDQFEQWLHAHKDEENTQLSQALRQADGEQLQCIVMVRDDFWMSLTRFMQALEVPLLEGHNSAAVDLFDTKHAQNVLAAFGRAYDRYPDPRPPPDAAESRFLAQAVDGLAVEGKVICVQLAVFAEMMKGRPWTPESLSDVGGAEGVGITFLDETFSVKTAPPAHRLHQTAVRSVLRSLLPERGSDIKGQMKSYDELLEESGYQQRTSDFDALLGILDSEVRLITPTDPDDQGPEQTPQESSSRFYQLTHDFLVPSMREWLTRKQKETRQGRAELALADRAAVWHARTENRQLPSLWQWLQIRRYTRPKSWTESQRKMMGKAALVHALRSMLTVFVLMFVGLISYGAYGWLQGRAAVETLLKADPQLVLDSADKAAACRFWTADELQRVAANDAETREGRRRQRHARLALVSFDSTQVSPLLDDALTTSDTAYVGVIRQALIEADAAIEEDCWSRFRNGELSATERFRAGVMLAGLAPTSDQWTETDFQLLVDELAALNSVYQPQFWPLLQDVGDRMLPPLEALFNNRERPESEQIAATNAIAFFAEQDVERLARLLLIASGPQYKILYEKYREVADEQTSAGFATSVQQQPTDDLDAASRIALGQERATSALTLLRQGERESILDVLRYQDDPEALTQFVHRCRARDVTPAELIELLELVDQRRGPLAGNRQKIDDSVMYGLLLALGEFSWDDLPPARQTLVERLSLIYQQDPSSGVHSATGWLLRQWGQRENVERVDKTPLPYDPTGHREWFVRKIEYESGGIGGFLAEKKNLYLTSIVFQPAEFTMGSPDNEPNHLSDETQHQVTLTRPIAVCDRELTWAQWDAFYGPRRRQAYGQQFSKTLGDGDPVFGVDWLDSVTYCRWLTEQAGLSEDEQCYEAPSSLPKDGEGNPTNWPLRLEGAGFRLPTEAEWEFICRSGTGSAYSFGHDEELLDRYAWYLKNSGDWSHATGELRPNPRGLFDIHGNVYEWCHDWYNEGELSDATDPPGADTGSFRVPRGGSWNYTARLCRSSFRIRNTASFRFNGALGFRLAAVPSSQGPEAEQPGSGADSAGRLGGSSGASPSRPS